MNLLVIAGAKIPPLLRYSSFLAAFFCCFLNFNFKLLKFWLLKVDFFLSPALSEGKGVLA